jgi:hypothetical protein
LGGAARAALCVRGADAPADLQDAGTLDADGLQELDHRTCGGVEPTLAVPGGEPPGEALVEEAVIVTRGTAACHAAKCSGRLLAQVISSSDKLY